MDPEKMPTYNQGFVEIGPVDEEVEILIKYPFVL